MIEATGDVRVLVVDDEQGIRRVGYVLRRPVSVRA